MSPEPPHPSREELFAYRDGELTAERRVLIEAHVATCRTCRELIDQVSQLEAHLKRRPEPVDDAYFERLTESVLRRVSAEAPAPRAERRRSEAEGAPIDGRERPKPRFFWPAVFSTATAAAAILVVVLMVTKEGPFTSMAPQIATVEESAPDAGRLRTADSATAVVGETLKQEGGQKASNEERELASAPAAEGKAKGDLRDQPAKASSEANRSESDLIAGKDQTVRTEAAKSAAPPPAPAAAEPGVPSAASLQKVHGQGAPPAFDAILGRYGLPPDWGPGVSDEVVLRVEPQLRNLYRTGGATTAVDSARVRLYLAEAARTRAGAAPDSAAIAEIAHHYRRVIRIAGPDSRTGQIAAARLADFLSEVGATP